MCDGLGLASPNTDALNMLNVAWMPLTWTVDMEHFAMELRFFPLKINTNFKYFLCKKTKSVNILLLKIRK